MKGNIRMAEKSIKKNYLFNLSYQILSILTPLITTPYVSRILGADGIGQYSFASSIVSYFSMAAIMGTGLYGQREISYNQKNIEKRSSVFWNTVIFRCITTFISTVVYMIFIKTSGYDGAIYSIMVCNILVVAVDISWFFQGMEEFKKIAIRDAIFKIFSIVLIFAFVKESTDLILYIVLMLGVSIMSAFSFWTYVPRYITAISVKTLRPFKDLRVIFSLFIPTIAVQIYTVLDKTMIGLITNDNYENGYYEQALKVSKMAVTVITALGTVMIPRVGLYFAEGKKHDVEECMYRGYRFALFLGVPMCLGLIGIADNMVPWFFGPGYDKVAVLIKILAFLLLAIGINNVTGMQYLIPTKRQNLYTKTVVIGSVINFILNASLIPILGSIGAAIASIVAETVIAVIQLVYVRKELEWKKIIYSGWRYYIAGIIMYLMITIENIFLEPSIFHTSIMIISGGSIYLSVLVLLQDSFFIKNFKNILEQMRKCKRKY